MGAFDVIVMINLTAIGLCQSKDIQRQFSSQFCWTLNLYKFQSCFKFGSSKKTKF